MPLARRSLRTAAFTLVELLVVITIIGILAGIALPVYNGVTERANQTKALAQAKQIGLALKLYAGDNDGAFPSKVRSDDDTLTDADITNANQAFRQLIPNYINQEKIFYVGKSKFTPKQPDENMASGQKLKAGENHFAYVMNLTDTSNSAFPLVADGFAAVGADPAWTSVETEKGGVWKGKKAIVLRVDQSAEIVTLGTATSALPYKAARPGAAAKNLFAPDADPANPWLSAAQKVLNPEYRGKRAEELAPSLATAKPTEPSTAWSSTGPALRTTTSLPPAPSGGG